MKKQIKNKINNYTLPSIWSLLRDSWLFFQKHWDIFIKLVLIYFLPLLFLFLLSRTLVYLKEIIVLKNIQGIVLIGINIFITIIFILGFLFLFLLSALVGIAVILAIANPQQSIKDLLNQSLNLFARFLWVYVLVVISVSIASLLFVIPGFILSVFYIFVGFAVIYEGKRGFSALKRSIYLVKDFWFSILVRLFVWFFIGIIQGVLALVPYVNFVVGLAVIFIFPVWSLIYVKLIYDQIILYKKKDINAVESYPLWMKIIFTLIIFGIMISILILPKIIVGYIK